MSGILEDVDVYTLQKVLDQASCPASLQLRLGQKEKCTRVYVNSIQTLVLQTGACLSCEKSSMRFF